MTILALMVTAESVQVTEPQQKVSLMMVHSLVPLPLQPVLVPLQLVQLLLQLATVQLVLLPLQLVQPPSFVLSLRAFPPHSGLLYQEP